MTIWPALLCCLFESPPASSFDLHTADATRFTGPLLKLQADWSVSLGGPKPVQLSGVNFVSLRRTNTPLPPHPVGEHVLLADGSRLAGTLVELRDERLHFRASFGPEFPVPLSLTTLIWLVAPTPAQNAEQTFRRLAAQRRTRDVVLMRNNDTVEGTLNAINAKIVRLEVQGKEIEIERAKVAGVALNSELIQRPRPKGVYGHLVLADGSRLGLLSAASDSKTLTGKALFGASLAVPLERVVALDVYQGPAVYLSDIKSNQYEHTPYLAVRWPFVNDASVAGQPLRVAGSTFDKGIGLHSTSRLTYDLAAGYRWFEALVGLDEHTGRKGSVRVRVLVDGKPVDLGEDRELTGRDPPRVVRVPVVGAKQLTLVVEFGRRGDVGDHVNWADARLLR